MRALPIPPLRLGGVAVACCLITVFALGVLPVNDPDFWWHLATGRYMAAHQAIPHYDVFSFSAADHRWITHEWVTELLYYGGWSLGGARLLALASALVIAATFALVYLAARERGAHPLVGAPVVLLAALASAHTWGTRPQMLSLLCTAIYGLALSRVLVRSLPAPPIWLAGVMVLWVNLHGGFIFGLALLAICTTGHVVQQTVEWAWAGRLHAEPEATSSLLPLAAALESPSWALATPAAFPSGAAPKPAVNLRRCALVLALTALATLANPNLLAGALYPLSYLGNNASTRYVDEWVSPNFHLVQYQIFEGLLLVLLVAALANPRRARLADVLVLLPFLYLALQSVRNINLFAVVAAPIAAELVTLALPAGWTRRRLPRPLPRAKLILNWLAVLFIGTGVAATAVGRLTPQAQARAVSRLYPVDALRYVQTHPLPARGLDNYNWGGYLIWNWYPGRRVFVDGRPDMYGDSFMDRYVRAYRGDPSWRALFATYGLCYALVEPQSGIAAALRSTPGWTLRYRDSQAQLFVDSGIGGCRT